MTCGRQQQSGRRARDPAKLPAVGRLYAFHSDARGGCPPIDWHVVLQEGGVLVGMISWNNMKSMAHASGRLDMRTGAFQMTATEVGGQGRTATINGTVTPSSGWLKADIQGPNANCQGIQVPWFYSTPRRRRLVSDHGTGEGIPRAENPATMTGRIVPVRHGPLLR